MFLACLLNKFDDPSNLSIDTDWQKESSHQVNMSTLYIKWLLLSVISLLSVIIQNNVIHIQIDTMVVMINHARIIKRHDQQTMI